MNLKLISTIMGIVPILLQSMSVVEKVFAKRKGSGEEKKEAYIEAAMVGLGVTEGVMHKDLANDEKFRKLVGKFADVTVELNNFIADYKANKP